MPTIHPCVRHVFVYHVAHPGCPARIRQKQAKALPSGPAPISDTQYFVRSARGNCHYKVRRQERAPKAVREGQIRSAGGHS
jgi:hypothetical protein